jgi:hypothetical protein
MNYIDCNVSPLPLSPSFRGSEGDGSPLSCWIRVISDTHCRRRNLYPWYVLTCSVPPDSCTSCGVLSKWQSTHLLLILTSSRHLPGRSFFILSNRSLEVSKSYICTLYSSISCGVFPLHHLIKLFRIDIAHCTLFFGPYLVSFLRLNPNLTSVLLFGCCLFCLNLFDYREALLTVRVFPTLMVSTSSVSKAKVVDLRAGRVHHVWGNGSWRIAIASEGRRRVVYDG